MGVTSLWPILEPVKQHVPLSRLKGKTLAVDLSLWVCEAQTVKKMIGVVTKPHLRNLYFRVSSLTLMGIQLVFVMEGDPPKLKARTMHKRTETRFGPSKKPVTARTGRSRFKFLLKECLEMLDCLGVPWVQAAGEAEAMCAYLNANGYVDGCVTNDGDAFLYGAQTVYRNFTMNVKDPHVDCYSISAIEEKLGCSRESLIGLAVLLGCDYLPKGVPGVGKEQALKLIRTLRGQSLLQRFEHWLDNSQYSDNPVIAVKKVVHCTVCRHPGSQKDHERVGCQVCESVGYCEPHDAEYCCPCDWHSSQQAQQVGAVEDGIRKKAKACEGFPFHEVIQEYLINKDKQLKLNESQRPNLLFFQRFAFEKMDWTKRYACEKLWALLTYYDMNRRKSGHVDPQQLQALRIVKTRTKNGIPCFEIEWQKPDHYATADDQFVESFFTTTEESSLFQAAYPEIVALYQMEKLEIGKAKKKGKRTKHRECSAEDSEVADLLSRLNLQSSSEPFPGCESKFDFETAFNHRMLPRNDSLSKGPNVGGNVSTTVVKHQNAPSSLPIIPPQNAGSECSSGSSLGSQVDFINQPVDPDASSAIADLQLSGIDWEGTSFSVPPTHINGICYDSESGTCSTSAGQPSPLHHKTAEIITPYSDSIKYCQDLPINVTCFASNSNSPEGQNHFILKQSAFRAFSDSTNASLVTPLQTDKHVQGVACPRAGFSSSSSRLYASTWEIENGLSEKYLQGLGLQRSQGVLNHLEIPVQAAQRPKGLCTGTVEPPCSANVQLALPLKPTEVLGICEARKHSVQTSFKSSLKKSVCQNGDSSEESDSETVKRRNPHKGSKWQRGHNPKDKSNNKRGNSESTQQAKLRGEVPDFQVLSIAIPLKEHPKTPSVVHVHISPSPAETGLGMSYPLPQQSASDSEAWVRSPLPLSERLKLRMQSN